MVDDDAVLNRVNDHCVALPFSLDFQQLEDQRHADVLAVLHLLEVARARVVVHGDGDLVHTRQRMQDAKRLLRAPELVGREDVAVLEAQIVFLVEEALALHARHVEDVQLRHDGLEVSGLRVRDVLGLDVLLLDIARQLELLGGDEHEADAGVTAHRGDEGVYRAAEFEVAAETHREVFKAPHLAVDGQKVGERLRGVVVAAVACVDDGHERVHGGDQRRALLGMAHGDDVAVAAHGADRVRHALALGGGRAFRLREAEHLPAEGEHRALKAQTGAGGGLEEEGREDSAVALVRVFGGVVDDVAGGIHQLHDLLLGELQNIDQAFHISLFLLF